MPRETIDSDVSEVHMNRVLCHRKKVQIPPLISQLPSPSGHMNTLGHTDKKDPHSSPPISQREPTKTYTELSLPLFASTSASGAHFKRD
jgi:hypothetical protein